MQGTIFNIQRYSVNDGPGIRTLVFFKGCPLRCDWCSNPESHRAKPQIMAFDNLCSGCGACAEACKHGCIHLDDGRRVYLPVDCELCGRCEQVCPNSAIKRVGTEVDVPEVVTEAEKDFLFYLNSGGGVTLGGGEPTFQADFAATLLKKLKAHGIHTAMETCGYAPWPVFERLLPDLDLLLFDVKHIDATAHKRHTGVSNQLILNNLEKLLAGQTPVITRIPLIPGFNDNATTMSAIAAFLSAHRHNGILERVDLLPYHKLGVGKYAALGTPYKLNQCQTPEEDFMADLKGIFVAQGFNTLVEYL